MKSIHKKCLHKLTTFWEWYAEREKLKTQNCSTDQDDEKMVYFILESQLC